MDNELMIIPTLGEQESVNFFRSLLSGDTILIDGNKYYFESFDGKNAIIRREDRFLKAQKKWRAKKIRQQPPFWSSAWRNS